MVGLLPTVWSFSVWLINHCYRDLLLDFQKRFTVKAFFRKDCIDNLLWNIAINGDFAFSDTFCCVRCTVPNYKIGLIIIYLWLQNKSCTIIHEFCFVIMRD